MRGKEKGGGGGRAARAESKRQRTKFFFKITKPNYSYLLIAFHISSRHRKMMKNVRTVL